MLLRMIGSLWSEPRGEGERFGIRVRAWTAAQVPERLGYDEWHANLLARPTPILVLAPSKANMPTLERVKSGRHRWFVRRHWPAFEQEPEEIQAAIPHDRQ